jgi:hypothetical protein
MLVCLTLAFFVIYAVNVNQYTVSYHTFIELILYPSSLEAKSS